MTFTEHAVRADGFQIRYLEAGEGDPLVCFHGAGGLRMSRAHDLLTRTRRVIAFELPGFGASPANERSTTMADLAQTMLIAVDALGIDSFDLWGTSFGGRLAVCLALATPGRLRALVLAAPAVIRTARQPPRSPEELAAILYAHPERRRASSPTPPDVLAKERALVDRLIGPPRDPELEAAMRGLTVPTLVLFGTEDRLTPPELGREYRRLLPDCQFVIVYDAAHAIDSDRPEAFATIVDEFLKHHGQFVVRRESRLLYP